MTSPDSYEAARTPPHDEEAERAVIGGMLLAPAIAGQVIDMLGPGDFYHPRHATIFKAVAELHGRDEPTDQVAVAAHLSDIGDLVRIGGAGYLHTCTNAVPTPDNAPYYAKIVAKHARARTIGVVGTRLVAISQAADNDQLDQLLDWARDQIDQAAATTKVEGVADTWAPLDLTPTLTGGILTPPPTLLTRADGTSLLYLGRIHSLSGEPEAGKTWVALEAVKQSIASGTHVLYLDFEDTPEGIVGRLLAMGAHPESIRAYLHYVRPDRAIDGKARTQISALLDAHPHALAVIDGVTEAMTLHGLDPYNNPDAAKFYEMLPRFITRHRNAPAVLLIDHVPKSEDRSKRFAIGAQHKLAGLDGAAFVVDIVQSFAPGQPGFSRIRVAKDRPGQVRRNAVGGVVAELHVHGHDEVVTVELRDPEKSKKDQAIESGFRPTFLMERISKYVEGNPGVSRSIIEGAVRGKRDHLRHAIDLLVYEGYLHDAPGPRNATTHTAAKPFREQPVADEDSTDEGVR